MKRLLNSLLYSFVFILSIQGTQAKAGNETQKNQLSTALPVEIQTLLLESESQGVPDLVCATIYNRTSNQTLSDLALEIQSGGNFKNTQKLQVLNSGQSQLVCLDGRAENSQSYLLKISYKLNTQPNTIAYLISPSIDSKKSNQNMAVILPSIISSLSALIGGIVGAFLLHLFTSRREQQRANFEWSKTLFDKYEQSYRNFLNSLGGVAEPNTLRVTFDQLTANSLVPSNLRQAYDKTYIILSGNGTQDEKQRALQNLRIVFENAIRNRTF